MPLPPSQSQHGASVGAAGDGDDYDDDVAAEDIETIDMDVDSPVSNNDYSGIVENYASPPERRK